MIYWMNLVNFAMSVAGLVLTSLGLLLAVTYQPMERWTRNYFITNFIILIIYTSLLVVDYFCFINDYSYMQELFVFAESLFSSLLMPLLTVYMLRLCREKLSASPLFFVNGILWTLYFALLVYTQFTTVIYSIEPDGDYRRGPLYPLLLVPPAAIMILNLAGLWHRKQKLNKRQYHAMLSYITIPLVSMLIQMFTYGLLLVAYGTITGALIMFMFILSEQTDMVVSQVRENARKEFNLKVLQMRPHFIYNTMTSIYYLVDTDPQKAKKAIRDFSRYLHQNFNAVVKTELIPFTEELTHTKAYLAVEHARFGNRLEVTYDIPHTSFHLPPLTLEPIVENAVKHGMDPDSGPLHILIRTRTLENGSEVTVENNGTDFIQGESDNFNVGLNSVSERLSLMCGGTLNIMPHSGGGTVVTLTIPGSAL